MDAYESMLKSAHAYEGVFECVRVIDMDAKKLLSEKIRQTVKTKFPALNLRLEQKLFRRALASNVTLHHVKHAGGAVYLCIIIPALFQQCRIIIELITEITGKLYVDYAPYVEDGLKSISMMRRLSVTDELTCLYNRRHINEQLPMDILSCARHNRQLSVIFADLDCFKNVNDRFGHVAGDYLLCEFAKELSRNIREDKDWASRYGGDEFLLCLNGVDNGEAVEVAERIRKAVMNRTFSFSGHEIRLTCSFGVHTIREFTTLPTLEEILDAIDLKLYQAKSLGKNMTI